MISISLANLEATQRFARSVSQVLVPGDVVELRGEVGAGKSTLVSAVASNLGVTEPVRSPTYTVAHLYAAPNNQQLAHLDLYQAQGELAPSAWADIEPYFDATWVFIEWPAAVESWVGSMVTLSIDIEVVSSDARVVHVDGRDTDRVVQLASEYSLTVTKC